MHLSLGSVEEDLPGTRAGSPPCSPLEISAASRDSRPERSFPSSGSGESKTVDSSTRDVIALYEGRECLLYFDFLFRFWVYWDTAAHTVSYLSAFGFFVGGMCFIVGTFAALSPSVQALQRPLSCGTDGYSWWTAFPYLLGNILWQIACTLQIIESINTDYAQRLEVWEAEGRADIKPRYRWFGIRLTSFEWWGAVNYDVGVALYLTAQIFTYISMCPDTQLSNNLYTICINDFYLVAGVLFLLAGLLYIPVLGSPWILPNIFIPLDRQSWTSMMWWAVWLYFWGGVLFFTGGVFLHWYSPNNMKLSLLAYQIESSICFGGGSFFFLTGALLLLMRQSRSRCKPSYFTTGPCTDLSMRGQQMYRYVRSREDSA